MAYRRPGLQRKWSHVVNSLQDIVPSYEVASGRIALFADRKMRSDAILFAVKKDDVVLDLGAGPGTMSKLVSKMGGRPVLVDVSKEMLAVAPFSDKVQATFERLPFRDGAFDAAVSGFALRDSLDLYKAVSELGRVVRNGGRFSACDLGKSDSLPKMLAVAFYMRVLPPFVGLLTAGRSGLKYGSLFDTYVLTLSNSQLRGLLSKAFKTVSFDERQLGGAIVATCVR